MAALCSIKLQDLFLGGGSSVLFGVCQQGLLRLYEKN
jgi:hypothetical protein